MSVDTIEILRSHTIPSNSPINMEHAYCASDGFECIAMSFGDVPVDLSISEAEEVGRLLLLMAGAARA